MNIFEYFGEEEHDIDEKLIDVTANYGAWTREQVFDQVKMICDQIMGHMKKQTMLLLENLDQANPDLAVILQSFKKDHLKVEDEIGQLTQVHVDEPGYDEYLRNLLQVFEEHIRFSQNLYHEITEKAPQGEIVKLNAQFNNVILHSTDFNSLQAS
jgi:hypothetical protein